jgi:hypothetical protein
LHRKNLMLMEWNAMLRRVGFFPHSQVHGGGRPDRDSGQRKPRCVCPGEGEIIPTDQPTPHFSPDTQSWFHSQEVNVMADSSELVGEWLRGIDANQNTRLYGRVSNKDGSSFFKRLKGLRNLMGTIGGTRGI